MLQDFIDTCFQSAVLLLCNLTSRDPDPSLDYNQKCHCLFLVLYYF